MNMISGIPKMFQLTRFFIRLTFASEMTITQAAPTGMHFKFEMKKKLITEWNFLNCVHIAKGYKYQVIYLHLVSFC